MIKQKTGHLQYKSNFGDCLKSKNPSFLYYMYYLTIHLLHKNVSNKTGLFVIENFSWGAFFY